MKQTFFFILFAGLSTTSLLAQTPKKEASMPATQPASTPDTLLAHANTEIATLGGGCFWCVEAIYQDLKGVLKVESGYSGGKIPNPSYREVCTGTTGHAEVIQVTFDSSIISYHDILEVFFTVHDPTTLNRQGHDEGTQYRSVIFYHSPEQMATAEEVKKSAQEIWDDPIVTEIAPFTHFYKAEDYHQNYYKANQNQSYCSIVITPKVRKFREKFRDKLKE